ncbi:Uncharacterised protein [Legionella wadsworthii]|uniref:Ankyrin repeat protein n=1 Tax=Legionella wadsworthii TaxID=28088 RepID=A0A378LXV2_9GAMM|nr:DUF5630 domain-containing protein [Legionella wadsworthii]STY31291.1 Uncharacterised protein [Legionella wadsworthii]
MSHAREHVFTFVTLSEFLRLNFLEEITLKDVKSQTFNESKFFSTTKSLTDIGFIIKMAHASPDFVNMCKKDKYAELWSNLYSQLGFALSSEENPLTFYTHDNVDSFDLLRGTYFYYLSQQVRTAFSDKFSSSEVHFLKEAMRFNSIHAVQRYNEFLYHKVANEQLGENENAKSLLKEAIQNTNFKPLLELHGSYAYMLLAEAYYRYALFAKNQRDTYTFTKAIEAAISSCNKASKYLEQSKYSIQNASLGKGLAFSNSFGVDSPDDAKNMLEDLLKQNLPENPDNSSISPA